MAEKEAFKKITDELAAIRSQLEKLTEVVSDGRAVAIIDGKVVTELATKHVADCYGAFPDQKFNRIRVTDRTQSTKAPSLEK